MFSEQLIWQLTIPNLGSSFFFPNKYLEKQILSLPIHESMKDVFPFIYVFFSFFWQCFLFLFFFLIEVQLTYDIILVSGVMNSMFVYCILYMCIHNVYIYMCIHNDNIYVMYMINCIHNDSKFVYTGKHHHNKSSYHLLLYIVIKFFFLVMRSNVLF